MLKCTIGRCWLRFVAGENGTLDSGVLTTEQRGLTRTHDEKGKGRAITVRAVGEIWLSGGGLVFWEADGLQLSRTQLAAWVCPTLRFSPSWESILRPGSFGSTTRTYQNESSMLFKRWRWMSFASLLVQLSGSELPRTAAQQIFARFGSREIMEMWAGGGRMLVLQTCRSLVGIAAAVVGSSNDSMTQG